MLEAVTLLQMRNLSSFERFVLSGTRPVQLISGLTACLHFLPWNELKLSTSAYLESKGISLDVRFGDLSEVKQWTLWRPPFKEFAHIHHIRIKDELHEYNLVNEWTFPGFETDGVVIFAAKGLGDGNSSQPRSTSLLHCLADLSTHWVISVSHGYKHIHIADGILE